MTGLRRLLFISMVGMLCAGVACAETYKWLDAQGHTHYSDTPPPPDARNATEKKMRANVVETSGGGYAEREATRRAPVTVWLGNECDALCESALSLLKNRGIAYTEQRITSEEQKQAFVARFKLKDARVPAIAAGADQLVGFSAESWNKLLDRAGYPVKGSAKPPAAAKTPPPAAAEPEAQ